MTDARNETERMIRRLLAPAICGTQSAETLDRCNHIIAAVACYDERQAMFLSALVGDVS